MVIDFTVVDDDGVAVGTLEGLASAVQVDDLEAHGSERNGMGLESSVLIRAAVEDGVRCAADHLGVEAVMLVSESSDAAHSG